MSDEKEKAVKKSHAVRWSWLRRPPPIMDWIRPLFEPPNKLIEPYVKKNQVVADLACAWGYYTFPLADLVGMEGKVFAVDLGENCIRAIQKKANKRGYHNIEAHAGSVCNMSYIKDRSVDFVFANGLLCSMEDDRPLAVKEIKRILKQDGRAYLSLGEPPPLGLVDEVEWKETLAGFHIEAGGSFKGMWALVSLKTESA